MGKVHSPGFGTQNLLFDKTATFNSFTFVNFSGFNDDKVLWIKVKVLKKIKKLQF